MVFEQVREVQTPGGTFKDIDMEIEVEMTKDGNGKFDVNLFNLKRSTWQSIKTEAEINVVLGWANGPSSTVMKGTINTVAKSQDGRDIKFQIKGKDSSNAVLNQTTSSTWEDTDPGTIAGELASAVGLTPKTKTVGSPISGYWAATTARPIKGWLNELETIAEDKTGVDWEWYAETGRLYFQKKKQTTQQAPVLGWDQNLLEIGRSDSSDDSGTNDKLSFKSMMVPGLSKGQAAQVVAEPFSGTYRVQSYRHKSETTTGDHITSGVLISPQQSYSVGNTYGIDVEV